MDILKVEKSKIVTDLLNSIFASLKSVVPITFKTMSPQLLDDYFNLKFGVLIGLTGDVKGKLVIEGAPAIFSSIGEFMFGAPLQGEMLLSFSGELGNMIAGGFSTNMAENGDDINITYPTIIQGDTMLSGYKHGVKVRVMFENTGDLDVFLLLD